MPEQDGTEFALPAEVAELLRTNDRHLAQMRYKGNGPQFVKRGGRILYRWSDVRDYIAANTAIKSSELS
jgi:hypothetical protein